jgi:sarcosine oxidase subunit alpha
VTGARLPSRGSRIDRSRPIRFVFDDAEYDAFEGDTVASALLANGVVGGFRSPILGRPRGVMGIDAEEPNAFVEITEPWFEPIVAATTVDVVDGMVCSSRAGKGVLGGDTRGRRRPSEHRYRHVELLVIGAGHDALYPAEEAAARGERVLVVDRGPSITEGAGSSWRPEGVEFLTRATALGLYDDGEAIVHERTAELDRLWHLRAERVILATGTRDQPIAFAGNDRPGVMLASAAVEYDARFGVRCGERAVLFGVNPPGALWLREAGAEVVVVADVRPDAPTSEDLAGFDHRPGWVVRGTEGSGQLSAVHLEGPRGASETVACDLLLVSGGRVPVLDLWRAIGGGLRFDETLAVFLPDGSGPDWLSVMGSAAGDDLGPGHPYPFVPADDLTEHFVDLQRDQTVADVLAAVDGGLRSIEHVKRATYIGTAIDQGRTSGVPTAAIVNAALAAGPGAQGPSSARPPTLPVPFAVLAGLDRGDLLDPIRTTPIHAWHVEHGALFENVGQWKRPWAFPRERESFDDAVARECLAVRHGVGMMDASTLGKIDVVGPDAAAFLDRMYTNAMSTLAVGRIRYGLMLGVDGMAFDDGVAMRVAEDRFLVTTTTGGAAKVLDHFEEWLQTEWPDLRVWCTSVTEQWATVAVAGPVAREVVAAAGTDVDLSREAFPFMAFRDGEVAGVPARIARVSFSGELAFEVNVAGWHGRPVWEALFAAGAPYGVTPYGTEAMHVLRAEKGFPIVGQDTDGTVTPDDVGMSWIVNETKGDFVGRRSLRRPDLARRDRKQLVGLLPESFLPEGAQVVLEDTGRIPMPMVGHVTSSYRSAALERPVALAMIERGRELEGTTVLAPLLEGTVAAVVTSPVFWDPENARRDGEPER